MSDFVKEPKVENPEEEGGDDDDNSPAPVLSNAYIIAFGRNIFYHHVMLIFTGGRVNRRFRARCPTDDC